MQQRLFAAGYTTCLVLGVFVTHKHLPAKGDFLINTPATLFWAGFLVVVVSVAGLTSLNDSPRNLAVLCFCQVVGANLLAYGGLMSYLFFGPRTSYAPALALALLVAGPAAARLKRCARPHATLVLAGAQCALGASLAYVAGRDRRPASFQTCTAVFAIVAALSFVWAHVSESTRSARASKGVNACAAVFLFVSAVLSGVQSRNDAFCSLESVASSLGLLTLILGVLSLAQHTTADPPAASACDPEAARPEEGATRLENLMREASRAQQRPPVTRFDHLMREAGKVEAA
jgi:peptidoglycan/LPS O-acetylase OafA/YrhL